MGTSASFRAPAVPRWQAFTTALYEGMPPERVQSELFNAGSDWETALAGAPVAEFAIAIVDRTSLADRIATTESVTDALRSYIADARAASLDAGPTAALALAERAMAALLTRVAAGGNALADQSPENAAAEVRSQLGKPNAAVEAYLGELIGQFARHVVSREAGRLTEGERGLGVSAVRDRITDLAERAQTVAEGVAAERVEPARVREEWASFVHEVFRRGRTLPEGA